MHETRNNTPDGASGNVIRFLWFDGVSAHPLWDAGRVTPEDEQWLRQVVGLSDILIGQLRVWAGAREAAGSHAGSNAMSALDVQADALVAALDAELQLRFKVEHLH